MHRVKCYAGAILALVLGAMTTTATRAQTLDCGTRDACVAFAATTVTASAPGDVEVIRIYYGLKSGSWTNLRITLDVPEYFLGSELLNDPLFNESCELEATGGETWNISCDWVSASNPWVLSGANTYVGELYLTVVSRRYQTPADYDAVFSVSLSGENNGVPVSDTAVHVMNVDGDARLIPYNTSSSTGVITRTIDGEPVLGRVFTYLFRAQNNFGTPTVPIPGSNALDDVTIELELPPYMLLHAVDQESNTWSWPTDQIGEFGAEITFSLGHPLGRTGEALDWDRSSTSGARGYGSNWVRVFVFVPCQADAERGWPGLPVSDAEEPARVRYHADEVFHVAGDPPSTATEDRWWPATGSGYTAGDFYVGANPPAGSAWILNASSNTLGCNPSLPNSSKDDSFTTSPATVANFPNSRDVNNIVVSYLTPNLMSALGPTLVLDMVPPFHRVVDPVATWIDPVPASTGYEGNDRVFTAYLCKLPRTLEIPASNAPVNRGEPAWYRHHLDKSDRAGYPAGWFDPETWIGEAVPFPWGAGDGTWGCVTPDKVATQTAYGEDCGPLEPGMAFCASEATAAIASTGASDWVYVPANEGDPVLGPPHLRLRFRTWIEPFYDAVVPGWVVPNTDPQEPDDALNANAQNVARVYGGTYEIPIGSSQSLQQSWPNGVTDPIWIRNRPAVTIVANRLDPEIPLGEYGVIGCYWFGLGGEGQLVGARTTIELPPGFRLARADEPGETPVFTDLPANRPWAFEDGAVALFGDHCNPDVDTFLAKAEAAPTVATLDAGTPNERLAVTFDFADTPELPIESCGYGGGGGLDLPFRVAIEPIPGFQFVQDEPNVFRCTVAAPNLTDVFNQPRTVSAQNSVLVPMARLMKLDLEPVCDASGPAPAFDLRYENVGGQDIAGAYAIFTVPQTTLDEDPGDGAGPLALSFASATLMTHAALASLFYTTVDPATATATDWLPMPAPDPASVRGIKVDFGENDLAAWDATGRIRIVLAPSASATADHVGQWIRASGYLGSTDLPRVPSLLSEVLFLGECPARLMVVKYLDRDGDGERDAEPTLEPMLAGFDFTLDVTVDSPLSSSDTRPNPPFDPSPPPLVIDASDGRTATSSATVAMSFEVWPGQTIEVRETPPGTVVLVAGDEVPGVDWGSPASAYGQPDTITWAATTPIAQTHVQLFDNETTLEFGNRCAACTSDDLCMSGQCTEAGTCAFSSTDLECAQSDNLCFADSGACDPASGLCLYQQTECLPDAPTRVYILLEDTSQPGAPVLAGAAICHYDQDASPPTLVCATDPVTGELVVDASLSCEPAGPNPNE